MRIQYEGLALPVSLTLVNHRIELLKGHDLNISRTVTINFRDPDYIGENSCYYPVEVISFHKGDAFPLKYECQRTNFNKKSLPD